MNAIPLKILESSGRSHLTATEKEIRRESEVKIPDGEIVCPDHVKKNSVAFSEWNRVAPILIEAGLLKPADTGSLARYCITHSEYLDLIRLREEVSNIEPFEPSEEIELQTSMEERYGPLRAAAMWKKVNFIFSSQAVLLFDKAINQKLQVLNAYEDRLFLNMLARIKNVIQKKEPEKTGAEKLGLKKTWAS